MRTRCAFVVALALGGGANPAAPVKGAVTLVVVGRAPANHASAYREALDDALRSAVILPGGQQLVAVDVVRDYYEEARTILSRCEGSVAAWSVRGEVQNGDLLELTVAVDVLPSVLREEMMDAKFGGIDAQILYEWVGRPRIAVVVDETIDGAKSDLENCQSAIEDRLIAHGVQVFSQEQVKKLIQRDAMLAALDDPRSAQRIGQQLGVDLIVTGKCMSTLSQTLEVPISGLPGAQRTTMHVYTTYLQARGVRSATGEVLFAKRYDNTDRGGADISANGRPDAMLRSVNNLMEHKTKELIGAIAEGWRKSIVEGSSLALTLDGVDSKHLASVDRALASVPRVESVLRRSFLGSVATYDVRYRGLQSALEEALVALESPSLRLVGSESGSLSLKVTGGPERYDGPSVLVSVIRQSGDEAVIQTLVGWLAEQDGVREVVPEPRDPGRIRVNLTKPIPAGQLMSALVETGPPLMPVSLSRKQIELRTTGPGPEAPPASQLRRWPISRPQLSS